MRLKGNGQLTGVKAERTSPSGHSNPGRNLDISPPRIEQHLSLPGHQQLSVLGTCAEVLTTCLCGHRCTLLHLGNVSNLSFVHVSLRDILSWGMSGGVKLEVTEWLRPGTAQFYCLAAIVDQRDDSLTVYYNDSCLICSVDYQERTEYGKGALQPLNLFLLLESGDLFPFVHFMFYMPNTAISTRVYIKMLPHKTCVVFICSMTNTGIELLVFIHLKPKQFSLREMGHVWKNRRSLNHSCSSLCFVRSHW